MEQYLRGLYYGLDSPVAYTSFTALWRQIENDKKDKEITKDKLTKWLNEQYTYSLHRPYRRPSVYRKVMTPGIDDVWQADLVEMREFADSNEGFNYLLCVIDCYSKYAWVQPLKTKTGLETSTAFEKIFEQSSRRPINIHFDEGKEFYNERVKTILEKRNINYYSTFSDKKACIVERFNRTLKSRMWKYFTANETRKWIDVVGKLAEDYNNTFHSTIKMTPAEASKPENSRVVWNNIYGSYLAAKYELPKFKEGQTVRISKYKSIFDKGYLPNYTEEFLKIKTVVMGRPPIYKLEDLKGEELNGIWYDSELSPYNETENSSYKVEKVLGKKTIKGQKYVLVKYKGWPDKFNEWLPQQNIEALNDRVNPAKAKGKREV
jgi:hypothetical protein